MLFQYLQFFHFPAISPKALVLHLLNPIYLFTHSVSFSESNSLISIEAATEKQWNPNQLNDKSNPLSVGLIVCIILAIVVVILVIILVIIIIRRRDNRSQSEIDSFECSPSFPNTTYDYTKDDPIEAADSFIPYGSI